MSEQHTGLKPIKITIVDARDACAFAPDDAQWLPASDEEARVAARAGVGLFTSYSLKQIRERWWDRLAKATTPEEKLGCARMIDALAFAHGLHEHVMGAKLAADNRAKGVQISTENEAAAKASALDRWK